MASITPITTAVGNRAAQHYNNQNNKKIHEDLPHKVPGKLFIGRCKLKYKKCPSSLCCSNISECMEALLLPYVQLFLSVNDTIRLKTATFAKLQNSFNTTILSRTQPLNIYTEIKG